MPLTVHTDHTDIRAVLARLVLADPVGNTVLGTVGSMLEHSAWAAVDGERVAVRSGAEFPVQVVGTWDEPARTRLRALLADLPGLAGLGGPLTEVRPLLEVLGVDPRLEEQRLFRLDELSPPPGVRGRAVIADDSHRAFGRACVAAFVAEAHDSLRSTDALADRALDAGEMFVWVDDEPVAMACRRPVVSGSARVGPVYTPPAHRGHGYGSAVTSAATQSILDDGAVPVLFTDLANPTSNKIYQLLGYTPVSDRVVATPRAAGR